jgi:hypothetical protein
MDHLRGEKRPLAAAKGTGQHRRQQAHQQGGCQLMGNGHQGGIELET